MIAPQPPITAAQVDTPAPVNWYVQAVDIANGTTAPVTFPANIAQAFAFVSSFALTYGKDDHHVQTISVGATAVANNSQAVQVTARCEMNDDGKDKAAATLSVVVLGIAP